MISKYNHKELNWIDLKSPSKEEVDHIIDQLSIPSHIESKIKEKHTEDIIDTEDDFIFISLKGELSFVVNNKFILTIHSKPIQAFDNFSKEMELDMIIEEKSKIKDNKLLFAYLLKNLYLNTQAELAINNFKIKSLEEKIIQNNKKLKLFTFLSILFLITTIIFICL